MAPLEFETSLSSLVDPFFLRNILFDPVTFLESQKEPPLVIEAFLVNYLFSLGDT